MAREIEVPDLPVIYVAGAYRSATVWGIARNIHAAREASLLVWKLGAIALCPHANTAFFDGELPDERWLQGDLELLRRCDAILLVGGWPKSSGALAERAAAEQWGLPIFYPGDLQPDIHDRRERLKEWIDGWKRDRRTDGAGSAVAEPGRGSGGEGCSR